MDDRARERPASILRSLRGFVGRRVRAARRAMAGPPVEEALVHERLPLPEHLIALDSAEGATLLDEAGEGLDYHRLRDHFVPQRSPRFCGPATIAILLNALHAGGRPARRYDQDSVFTVRTEAVKPRIEVVRGGMGLPIFAGYLAAHDVRCELHFASESGVEAFRGRAAPLLSDPGTFVAVNFLRPALGQEGTGHISPLGAYHADSDRFLVLDVSRHRYPAVWVRADDLFAAMATDAGAHSRGFVVAGAEAMAT
jgi:hypothetical protein